MDGAEWWRRKLHRAPEKIAQEALIEAIDWTQETFGKNMTAWKWGTAHPAYYHHSNPQVRIFSVQKKFDGKI